ncbi:LysR substrate-binding domain-containing protein, partial [Klebsiella pneumoniae]|uniref:LysR substrate-binding domain-containing protein n=1 Tax=Klebsiella pneumoniae TaxID=573 RepID=UPI002175F29D
KPAIAMKTAATEAVRSLVAAGMGGSIQPDMAYRAWSLEGNMIEARKLDDLLEPLYIGLAWRRGSARPELVTPFLTIARENGSKHAAGLKHSI